MLECDRVWAAYALGDLEPGLFERSEWYAAGGTLALLFHGLSYVPLFTCGDAGGIGPILENSVRLPRLYINQRPEHLAAVERFYHPDKLLPMWRMALGDFRGMAGEVVRVGPERLRDLKALYVLGGGDAFASYQLESGYFTGIERDGRLVAVAGVHLASRNYGVAAVGNVLTHPDYRGRGFGTLTTSAVVRALLDDGIRTIVLNVEQTNAAAIRIYERMGFTKHCEFFEGPAQRRD